jgi:hypothetical protein
MALFAQMGKNRVRVNHIERPLAIITGVDTSGMAKCRHQELIYGKFRGQLAKGPSHKALWSPILFSNVSAATFVPSRNRNPVFSIRQIYREFLFCIGFQTDD